MNCWKSVDGKESVTAVLPGLEEDIARCDVRVRIKLHSGRLNEFEG